MSIITKEIDYEVRKQPWGQVLHVISRRLLIFGIPVWRKELGVNEQLFDHEKERIKAIEYLESVEKWNNCLEFNSRRYVL